MVDEKPISRVRLQRRRPARGARRPAEGVGVMAHRETGYEQLVREARVVQEAVVRAEQAIERVLWYPGPAASRQKAQLKHCLDVALRAHVARQAVLRRLTA